MDKLRILIFSAMFGAGHFQAAEAVAAAFRLKLPAAEITHLDYGATVNSDINDAMKKLYISLIKHSPKLWGKLYDKLDQVSPDSSIQHLINNIGAEEIIEYLDATNPDMIICTYPFIAEVLGQLKLEEMLSAPLVTVITDYAVHSQWVNRGIDMYIVGCEDVYNGLVARGIDPLRIKITGIPVGLSFEQAIAREPILAELGLAPAIPTVLVMGGAFGAAHGVRQICEFLAQVQIPLQTIVVCGRDEKLYASLDDVCPYARNTVLRFGFVDNVAEMMAVSNLLITKAGGMTVSEALTMHLPLVIFDPIPGQEYENTVFLQKIGAGRRASSLEELKAVLQTLLENPDDLNLMRQATAQAIGGKSAERAVEYMLQLIK